MRRQLVLALRRIKEELSCHLAELKMHPATALAMADGFGRSIDAEARLERLADSVACLEKDLVMVDRARWPEFSELPEQDRLSLKSLISQFDAVQRRVASLGAKLDAQATTLLDDSSGAVGGYMVKVEVSCLPRKTERSDHDDGSDGLVAKVKTFLSALSFEDCEGSRFTFPFPHGALAHDVCAKGGYEGNGVNYADLLRIGDVEIEVIARYRLVYDMVERCWQRP